MNNLYTDLAKVYETMYTTFIDYNLEYKLYRGFLEKYSKNRVLEIGCGTGNLSHFFIKDGYDYFGLDLSHEMLAIAKERNPNAVFTQQDMRFFSLEKPVESVMMTGRTISYLVKNEDVESTLTSIYENMEEGSIFCFDFIDANKFMLEVGSGKMITHEVKHNDSTYLRESKWSRNLLNGWGFDWESIFYKKEENTLIEIGKDNSTIRTFTKDEVELFLNLNGFEVREMIQKESYAFPTYVVVAQRK